MSAHCTLPHPPDQPLLTKEQVTDLNASAKQFSILIAKCEKVDEVTKALKEKADAATTRVALVSEGHVEENGKLIADLSEEALGLHIQRAEAAVILSRGKHRQAVVNADHVYDEVNDARREFCDLWVTTFREIKARESEAWNHFARTYFDPRSPMWMKASDMAWSSKVEQFLDSILSSLEMTNRGYGVSCAQACLFVIERMKAIPES